MNLELNKIYNEDCLSILKNIPDNSIPIVISDIPYGINYDDWDTLHNNTNSALGKHHESMNNTSFKKRGKPINGWSEADKKIPIEYQEWCESWMSELFRITKEGSPIILFSSRRYLHRVSIALENKGFLVRDVLIWEKDKGVGKAQRINNVLHKRGIFDDKYNNYRLGNLKPMYEPIVWAMKPYSKTVTDCVLDNGVGGFNCENGELQGNILRFKTNKRNMYHPTEKPIDLMKCLVSMFSLDDETIVLDMFAGSGTTLVACEELGVNYIGVELNENYYKLANERIESYKKEIS